MSPARAATMGASVAPYRARQEVPMHAFHRVCTRLALVMATTASSSALAFQWAPFEFPARDQHYVIEVRRADAVPVVIDVAVTATGGTFDVSTTMQVEQRGVAADDLGSAIFGSDAFGLMALGPALLYGPTFMLVPMLLANEDIAVRSDPIRILGFGRLHMDREEIVAGRTCVVMRLVLDADPSGGFEFAVAEDLPIPCYSVYGSGSDRVEVRVVRAQ
jgi:hypothetical protein